MKCYSKTSKEIKRVIFYILSLCYKKEPIDLLNTISNETRSNSQTISNKRIQLSYIDNLENTLKNNKESSIPNDNRINPYLIWNSNTINGKNLATSFSNVNATSNHNLNTNNMKKTNNKNDIQETNFNKENSFEYYNQKNLLAIRKMEKEFCEPETFEASASQKSNLNTAENNNNHTVCTSLNGITIEKAYTTKNKETWILVATKENENERITYHWINLNIFDMNKEQLKIFNKEY